MVKIKHYLFSISSHGLGHLSQASAVVNELVKIQPQARISIRSSFDKSLLKQWLVPDFTYYQIEDDIGMRMNNALDADLEESYKAYAVFHNNWFERVQTLAIELQDQCITLVLSDIAYLPLAAAQRAGIPNIAICSLNWADVVECYMVGEQVDNWLDQIKQVYQAADFFITPTPSMSMPWLEKKISVSPIGRVGKKKENQF